MKQHQPTPPSKWNSTRLVIALTCILYIGWVTYIAEYKDWPEVIHTALYAIAAIGGGYIGLNTFSRGGMMGGGVMNALGGMGGQAINIVNQTRYKNETPGFEDESDPEDIPL